MDASVKRLVENLQSDLRLLSSEAKKKHPAVKEAAESCIVKVRNIAARGDGSALQGLSMASSEILHPLLLGCDSKNPRVVQISLSAIQKLISHQALDTNGANIVVNELWNLSESAVEELKILQTVVLLLTSSNDLIRGPLLAKCLVLCFRIYFAKRDAAVTNTASATVRQIVSLIFERASGEPMPQHPNEGHADLSANCKSPPTSLPPASADAYMIFQDLCRLVNGDPPLWLSGLTEMSRVLGLELIEATLNQFPEIFKMKQFGFLLKEMLCPLVIKMFSPSVKYINVNQTASGVVVTEKPFFSLTLRLLRVISILITKMVTLLVTECEIFLSLLLKFLDFDKLLWQQALALEVLHKLTIDKELIRLFCSSYDMRAHSTPVLQKITTSLGGFIQGSFLRHPEGGSQPKTPTETESFPVGQNIPAFSYRGNSILLNFMLPQLTSKSYFLEMLDKNEAPPIPDGYTFSVAFTSLLDFANTIGQLATTNDTAESEDNLLFCTRLLSSTQIGLLASISLLLEASADESVTESLLKCLQMQITLSGKLAVKTSRDASLTALCKAALPPNYMVSAFSVVKAGSPRDAARPFGSEEFNSSFQSLDSGVISSASHVVAVGTPCPSPSLPLGSASTQVVLTSKNLQCMKALISVAQSNGSTLDTSWGLVMGTLQHLVWILGLRPTVAGVFRPNPNPEGSGGQQVITTAVMADLPVLSTLLSNLIDATKNLDEVALGHVLTALIQLSTEAMEVASTQHKEPSFFGVAKLLQLGMANISRFNIFWNPMSLHLLDVSSHSNPKVREFGVTSLTTLIRFAFSQPDPLEEGEKTKRQGMLLSPIAELNQSSFEDVRVKQVECVLDLLQNRSSQLSSDCWRILLSILGSVVCGNDRFGEGLVRLAFQCVQLIVTDFLPNLTSDCLIQSVEVVAKFGTQRADINVSLTAVGLLINISDYLFHHVDQLKSHIVNIPGPPATINPDSRLGVNTIDNLWLCLFTCLSDLCVDSRAPVRKSGCQTLFSTLSAHGELLADATWGLIAWQVLFPLLDRVKSLAQSASTNKVDPASFGGANILIHHSRDTESKQWAETKCLTLDGVVKVFSAKRTVLMALPDFPKAWKLLLNFIEAAARSNNSEVSLNSLRSFKELVTICAHVSNSAQPLPSPKVKLPSASPTRPFATEPTPITSAQWLVAWQVWRRVATAVGTLPSATVPTLNKIPSTNEPVEGDVGTASSGYLSALLDIFPLVFEQCRQELEPGEIRQVTEDLRNLAALPPSVDYAAGVYLVPASNPEISQTQQRILDAVAVVTKELLNSGSKLQITLPSVFQLLLAFVLYGCGGPHAVRSGKISSTAGVAEWVKAGYIPFAEASLKVLVDLYLSSCQLPVVISHGVLEEIVKTLRIPMVMKYKCPSQTTWKLTLSFIKLLRCGLPLARHNAKPFEAVWSEIAVTFEQFLFPHTQSPSSLGFDEIRKYEQLDCQLIDLIRTEILPHSNSSPPEFIGRIIDLLNRGSIHAVDSRDVLALDSSHRLREDFARCCFDTLLTFSYCQPDVVTSAHQSHVGCAAVTSLLQRCRDVVTNFLRDEKQTGVPMPRYRILEAVSVLKAVKTLIDNLRVTRQIRDDLWHQIFELYPKIVDLIGSKNEAILEPLSEALKAYGNLLRQPQ